MAHAQFVNTVRIVFKIDAHNLSISCT